MKVILDRDKCAGHGQCEMFASAIFRVGDDDVVELLREINDSDAAEIEDVRTAEQNCPEQVISLIDEQ
jgi:ferredoxin